MSNPRTKKYIFDFQLVDGTTHSIPVEIPIGEDGLDGFSPVVSIQKITGGHRISITDANGIRSIDVLDGSKGDPGNPGRGIVDIQRTSGSGAAGTTDTYTITYTDNTTSTFTVYNGADGTGGGSGSGENGATFTPYVDSEGNLSWSNDKGLPNPATVNIKGNKGDPYTLTDNDKASITQAVIAALPVYNGEVTEV